jgi:hypothetical protein
LAVDISKNGIRAYAFLAQFLVCIEFMRIKVIRNLFDFGFGQLGPYRVFDEYAPIFGLEAIE